MKLFKKFAIASCLIPSCLLLNARTSLREDQKFILITILYNERNEKRRAEYLECLMRNIDNEAIGHIHIIYDTTQDTGESSLLKILQQKKVSIIPYNNGRPTFEYCFNLANSLYAERNIILSNADIFFNNSLYELVAYNLKHYFLVLTRWNVQNDGSLRAFILGNNKNMESSQDTWIFRTPINLFKGADILKIGVPHCDGQIAYYARASGLIVRNPCKTIQCCHLHLSQVRHYVEDNRPPFRTMIPVKWETVAEIFG